MPALAPRNLVDLIQENNARVLDAIDRRPRHLVHVDQPLLFFLNQIFKCLVHLHLSFLGSRAKDVRQHVLDVDIHLLNTLVRHNFKGWKISLPHIDLNLPLVKLAFTQLLPQFFPRPRGRLGQRRPAIDHNSARSSGSVPRPCGRRRRQKNIQQPFFGVQLSLVSNVLEFFFTHIINRNLHQIAHHRLHITPHITNFRKL